MPLQNLQIDQVFNLFVTKAFKIKPWIITNVLALEYTYWVQIKSFGHFLGYKIHCQYHNIKSTQNMGTQTHLSKGKSSQELTLYTITHTTYWLCFSFSFTWWDSFPSEMVALKTLKDMFMIGLMKIFFYWKGGFKSWGLERHVKKH